MRRRGVRGTPITLFFFHPRTTVKIQGFTEVSPCTYVLQASSVHGCPKFFKAVDSL